MQSIAIDRVFIGSCTNSRIEAAKKLGISPRTLRYKLAKIKAKSDEGVVAGGMAAPVAYAFVG